MSKKKNRSFRSPWSGDPSDRRPDLGRQLSGDLRHCALHRAKGYRAGIHPVRRGHSGDHPELAAAGPASQGLDGAKRRGNGPGAVCGWAETQWGGSGDRSCLPSLGHRRTRLLFIHGSEDNFVHTDMVYRVYDACPTEKQLLVVDGAGHGNSSNHAPDVYFETVFTFLDPYVSL